MNNTQRIACVEQILISTVHPCGWISDGSSAKVIDSATVVTCEVSIRGLIIVVLDAQAKTRRVSWRMSQTDAMWIASRCNSANVSIVYPELTMPHICNNSPSSVYVEICATYHIAKQLGRKLFSAVLNS